MTEIVLKRPVVRNTRMTNCSKCNFIFIQPGSQLNIDLGVKAVVNMSESRNHKLVQTISKMDCLESIYTERNGRILWRFSLFCLVRIVQDSLVLTKFRLTEFAKCSAVRDIDLVIL